MILKRVIYFQKGQRKLNTIYVVYLFWNNDKTNLQQVKILINQLIKTSISQILIHTIQHIFENATSNTSLVGRELRNKISFRIIGSTASFAQFPYYSLSENRTAV